MAISTQEKVISVAVGGAIFVGIAAMGARYEEEGLIIGSLVTVILWAFFSMKASKKE